jgi:hypothetical protein
MRKFLAIAAFGMGLSAFGACGGGGDGSGSISDPVEGCKQANDVVCEKVFNCFTAAEKDTAVFKQVFGIDKNDCVTKFNADCTADKQNCKAGQTFHADKASECLEQYKKFNCDDIKADPPITPAACDQVCS